MSDEKNKSQRIERRDSNRDASNGSLRNRGGYHEKRSDFSRPGQVEKKYQAPQPWGDPPADGGRKKD